MKNDNNQFDIRTKYTHTINPNTGREVVIGGDRFFKLMEHGYKYDVELNRLYDKPLPRGSAYYELLRDNYRRVRGQWVKMSKEEAEAYDKDPNIESIYPDSDSDSDYPDIDEFEYDADGHAIFPF